MEQPSLDDIYKTMLPESHEAGLQAVYDYALAQAAKAFIAPVAAEQPPADPTV